MKEMKAALSVQGAEATRSMWVHVPFRHAKISSNKKMK